MEERLDKELVSKDSASEDGDVIHAFFCFLLLSESHLFQLARCFSSGFIAVYNNSCEIRENEEIQKSCTSWAQGYEMVFSSFPVACKDGAAVVAHAKNASVWLTGTPGEKKPQFSCAFSERTTINKGKKRRRT